MVSKCPCLTFSEAMPCLDAKISLVLTIVPHSAFYLIGPCNTHPYRQSHKATKIHTLTPLTYELFFQRSSKKEKGNRGALERVVSEIEEKKRKREVEKEMPEIDNPFY